MHILGLKVSVEDVALLFHRYSTSDLFTYTDFSDSILPCDDFYCRQLIGKKLACSSYSQVNYFEPETKSMYV